MTDKKKTRKPRASRKKTPAAAAAVPNPTGGYFTFTVFTVIDTDEQMEAMKPLFGQVMLVAEALGLKTSNLLLLRKNVVDKYDDATVGGA